MNWLTFGRDLDSKIGSVWTFVSNNKWKSCSAEIWMWFGVWPFLVWSGSGFWIWINFQTWMLLKTNGCGIYPENKLHWVLFLLLQIWSSPSPKNQKGQTSQEQWWATLSWPTPTSEVKLFCTRSSHLWNLSALETSSCHVWHRAPRNGGAAVHLQCVCWPAAHAAGCVCPGDLQEATAHRSQTQIP